MGSDGTLLPYTDTMNHTMSKAFIGAVITFSIKNQQYSVGKKSWNTAEQINLSTKRHRPVYCLYELNINEDEGDEKEQEQSVFDKFDELIKRLSSNEDKKQKEMTAAKDKLKKLLNVLETMILSKMIK